VEVELPPPQPESNNIDKKAANPPENVQKNRMESPMLRNLDLRCGGCRAGWPLVALNPAVTLAIARCWPVSG